MSLDEELDKKVTFIIPLHNRSHYMQFILKYYKEAGFKGKFLFTDDSTLEVERERNQALVREYENDLDLEYFPRPSGQPYPFWKNCDYLLERTKTKYVQMSCDDDIFLVPTLRKCIQALNEDDNVYVASGYCYYIDCKDTYTLNPDRIEGNDLKELGGQVRECYKKQWQLFDSNLSNDPSERIIKHFYPYFKESTMNGLQRTDQVIDKLKTCFDNNLLEGTRTSLFTELYWEGSLHLEGKSIIIDDLFWFRLHISHKKLNEFKPLHYMGKWSADPKFSEVYYKFADLIEQKALKQDMDEEKAWYVGDVIWASTAILRLKRFRFCYAYDIAKRMDIDSPRDFFSRLGRFLMRICNRLSGHEEKVKQAKQNKIDQLESKWGSLLQSFIKQIES